MIEPKEGRQGYARNLQIKAHLGWIQSSQGAGLSFPCVSPTFVVVLHLTGSPSHGTRRVWGLDRAVQYSKVQQLVIVNNMKNVSASCVLSSGEMEPKARFFYSQEPYSATSVHETKKNEPSAQFY